MAAKAKPGFKFMNELFQIEASKSPRATFAEMCVDFEAKEEAP